MVIYPEAQVDQVIEALGPWADEQWANEHALEIAQAEATSEAGWQQYFAWFNVGSSHVRLLQYVDAALAYDHADVLYNSLPDDDTQRPYRMLWYQTGPYWAYYYSGRYEDVINLANKTLNTLDDPTLEESIYWRAMGKLAIGETDNAIADLQETVRLNKNFWAGWDKLRELGVVQ
jgi:tetratricopeptide (TPR) repeat protein